MREREYTPTKASQLINVSTAKHSNISQGPSRVSGQFAILREIQALKMQARQLQDQNKQLGTEVDNLRHQKNLQQSKLLEQSKLDEGVISQYQKDKNYQLDLLKSKGEEDVSRLRNEYENRLENLQRELKNREKINAQTNQQNVFTEDKSIELRKDLQNLQAEIRLCRDKNSTLSEEVTRQEFANKKLEMLAEELQRQKNEMQGEIHLLLDIEAEKSRNISLLQRKIQESQSSEASLYQKLTSLTQNFNSLEEHIAVMKDRLNNADLRGEDLEKQLHAVELMLSEKEDMLIEQKDRELQLREELDSHKIRESKRLSEISSLASENQAVYRQLNIIRHKLYDVSIEQNIDL